MTLPNLLTLFRLIAAPMLAFAVWSEASGASPWLAVGLLGAAALTDLLDGPIARRFDQVSELGAILDPIADKILTLTALFLLARADTPVLWPSLFILWREIGVSGLRELLRHHNISSAVSPLAKWKTAAQFIAIFLLFCARLPILNSGTCHSAGLIVLWIAAILTLYTGADYLLRARRIAWK